MSPYDNYNRYKNSGDRYLNRNVVNFTYIGDKDDFVIRDKTIMSLSNLAILKLKYMKQK